uniref:BAG domain-containing protein n=1 Tax=Cuerna arida TaxID=1464854 RepID=A0A1B6G9Z2_9HEMI
MDSVVDSVPQYAGDVVMDYEDFGDGFPDSAGHLFEEPLMHGHIDIRSHLEDLAQRHPEFADQLRYPAWSNSTENNTGTWGRKRRGSGPHEPGETSKQQPQETTRSEASEEPGPLRGRTKENLRNTVPDMGQKQQQDSEEKETRGQRSWSAPPDNRTQPEKPRFVSKIEIHPVNPDAPPQSQAGDATKPPMAPPKPQPQPQPQSQPQPKSNVRHIPIFVEGRDEPVLPKNVEPEFTQSQAPPQSFHTRQHPQQSQFTQHFQTQPPPNIPPHYDPPRQQRYEPPPQARFEPPPQPRYEQPQPKPEPPQPQNQPQQEPQPEVNPRDPLYRVGCVQKEVDDLKAKVENFNGNSRSDKEYILLDELLTRNLIKLDDIETEGKEEVRAARKNTIKSIQRCISILENKVPLPRSEKKEDESMEVDQLPLEGSGNTVNEKKPEEIPRGPQGDVPVDQSSDEKLTEEMSQTNASNTSEVPSGEERNSESCVGKKEESLNAVSESKEA